MTTKTPEARDSIRPFRVNIPEAVLADLRRRLAETRLPEKETVADHSQGVPLKTVQQVLRYWQTDYDWRKVEARLNAVPNFITEIDGLDIHFIHVRSRHENALPLIVTHGWPGSVIEQLKIIGPRTLSRRVAIGARSLPRCWACRRHRNCSAFTPTCPARFLQNSTRHLWPVRRRRPVSLPRREARTNSSFSSTSMFIMPSGWHRARKQ